MKQEQSIRQKTNKPSKQDIIISYLETKGHIEVLMYVLLVS